MAQSSNEVTSSPPAHEGSMAAEISTALAAPFIEHVAPSIIKGVQMLAKGKALLILGPSRAGKTSFLDYLADDILQPPTETNITQEVHAGKSATLRIGAHGKTVLRIWKPRDVPGQVDPSGQVEYVEEYTPACLVVVLDATKFFEVSDDDSSLQWLTAFCLRLNTRLIQKRKMARKLKAMFVLINKWDQLPQMDETRQKVYQDKFIAAVRQVLDKRMHNEFYRPKGTNVIEVMTCVTIEKSKAEQRLLDRVIERIGLRLRE